MVERSSRTTADARVLHLLSQRPLLTGSGVTLAELCRHAAAAGWKQEVVCALPAGHPDVALPGVPSERVHALHFGEAPLDFDVPGMSDVMPYPSSRWRDMTSAQLEAYRVAWRAHLGAVIERTRPDVIHAHHVWLLSALAREVAPEARLVVHCHATGLRQMRLCPSLADEVCAGVARADAFVALHAAQADELAMRLDLPRERVHVVGAGYREDAFHTRGRAGDGTQDIAYAGKLAASKGVPWLLEAFSRLRARRPDARLHLAGGAGGAEGEALRARATATPGVVLHGRLDQPALAELLRHCRVLVLPSMYEGLPLVLAEARACGCRIVATALPGITSELAPHLGAALDLLPRPRLSGIDEPLAEDLPAFVDAIDAALERALDAPPLLPSEEELTAFSWRAVFSRVEAVWGGREAS